MSRQNRPRKGLSPRRSSYRDPYTYFVIASEGTETEPAYFAALQAHILKTPHLNRRVKIEVLSRRDKGDTHSDPHQIIELLNEFKENYVLKSDDELWLLIDRDHRQSDTEKRKIADIQQLCKQKGYQFCISTPCFELWLLLHLKPLSNYDVATQSAFLENKKINKNRTRIEKELSDLLVELGSGYNKNNLDMAVFFPKIQEAIENAFAAELEKGWDYDRLCTQVHVLVKQLLKL
jgi:RloB-like protein